MLDAPAKKKPKCCCCGCAVTTISIIYGIFSLIGAATSREVHDKVLSLVVAIVYFGVAFMNTSAWARSTSKITFVFAGIRVLELICTCILFFTTDFEKIFYEESKQKASKEGLVFHDFESWRELDKVKIDLDQGAMIIKTTFGLLCVMYISAAVWNIYMGTLYEKYAEYLAEKEEEKECVVVDF